MTNATQTLKLTKRSVSEILKQDFWPLGSKTETDFILPEGMTIALRREGQRACILKITQLPARAHIVINNPNEDILSTHGEKAIRSILTEIAKSLPPRLVEDDQSKIFDHHLTSLIMDCLLYAAGPSTAGDRRIAVFAPTGIQRAGIYIGGACPIDIQDRMRQALEPLLARISVGTSQIEKVLNSAHYYSAFRAEHDMDFIVVPNWTAGSGNLPGHVVEKMKIIDRLHDRLAAIDVEPFPIIEAICS